jgi:hypothetical protein
MPLQILKPADVVALTHVRMGIYGRNGVGKTTLASTITGMNVLVVSVDDENIRPYLDKPNMRVAKIRRWHDVIDVYDVVSSPKANIGALVWDTWTRVQDLALGYVCGYEPADPAKLRTYIDRIPKSPDGWKGWGQIGALCSEWQRNFNMLPLHIVYLMQENDREQRIEGDQSIQTGPRLTPSAMQGIRDSVEILGRLYVDVETAPSDDVDGAIPDINLEEGKSSHIPTTAREVRKLFIGQHERYLAKGPTHVLGRIIPNPTWQNLTAPLFSQNGKAE